MIINFASYNKGLFIGSANSKKDDDDKKDDANNKKEDEAKHSSVSPSP